MAGPEDQLEIMQAMDKLLVNFKKDGPERKTPEMVMKKIKKLDEYWTEFESNHAILKNKEDQSHTYFTHKKYEVTLNFYHTTKNFLMSHLPQERWGPAPIIRSAESDVDQGGSSSQGLETPTNPNIQQPHFQPRVDTNSTSKIEEMLCKQSSNYRAFARTAKTIDIAQIEQKWELDAALKSLQERWAAIDKLHWEIDGMPGTNYFSDETQYNSCEQQYRDMTRLISNKLGSLTYREKSTPTMELPTFSGGYQNWTSFKDLFTEAIHNNASIPDAQKMQHLKSKVKGEAEKLIQHLLISPNNYHTCWEILNTRYNNKKLIFTSHLNTILSLPTIQQPSATAIKKIHDTTKECLYAITNLGVDTSSWDPIIVHLISQKLDADTHNDYLEHLAAPRELPNLTEFLEFLEIKFTSLEASRRKHDGIKPVSSQQQESSSTSKKAHTYKAYSTRKKPYNNQPFMKSNNQEITECYFCKGNHRLFTCKAFLELQPEARRREVTKHNLCENCLFEHNGRCYSEKTCRVCKKNHNTILHDAYATYAINKQQNSNNESKKSAGNIHVSQDDLSETLLSTALIRVRAADNTLITLRALIDQGSQISLISEHAAQMLKLPRERCKGVVFGIGAKESTCKGVINITCFARHNSYTLNTNVYIMRNLINKLPNNSFQKPQWSFLENIQLADPDFHISRSVDLLLGADIYSTIIQEGIIRNEKSSLVAQQTRLGWILCGHVQTFQCNVVLNNVDDIQRFWSVEDISEATNMSQEDLECLQNYNDTTTRKEDGRYVVKYPFMDDMEEKLGVSKPMAAAQFRNLERKLSKQPNLSHAYQTFMEEYHSLNHMAECTTNVTPSYYLPHHGVERADSATTALRVVFNASAKSSTGYTLNDLMKRGPNLQQDLMSLILRWRQYQYAFTADIEKMFRQIVISDDHQHFQKILWRSSPDQLLREYQLKTVTYGMKAAPFLAMMTLKQLAMDDGHKYQKSRAALALQEEFYMDDLVSGGFTLSTAKQLQEDLIKLLQSGGFNLRKWTSNKKELLEGFSKAQSSHEAFSFKQSESTKTLGLQWHPEKDVFTFQLKIDIQTTKHTKRTLLSDISKIFDPIGWLSPITTKLKLLFKEVWLSNIQWDDELPGHIDNEWEKIRADLHQHLTHFQVQRWYQSGEGDSIELHGFCDASIKAYACVVYCKVQSKITLVAAKTRLVPANKNLTLPRLELSGAYLLTKLIIKIQKALTGHQIDTFGWTDSTAVLGWIQGDENRWKPFVANRVKQINYVIPAHNWRYVKSAENPADCASRGISAEGLKDHSLWWQGPPFLPTFNKRDEKDEPRYETNQEVRTVKQSYVTTRHSDDDIIPRVLNKHSNLTRAVRVIAWISRARTRQRDQVPYLTVTEIERAKHMIIKYVQENEFAEEIKDILSNKRLHSKSKILNLNPFLDQNRLLRVGGRIKHANLNSDMKHPMIIPHSSRLTELIIDHAHLATFHGGARLTSSHIRQSYWIIGGNRAVKRRLLPCVVCRRYSLKKQHQLMGDLPEPRINPTRPFFHTGVDFTGYVDVKMNKGRGARTTKGYIAVFVCMATKAVHLELVSDLTSSAFLAALKRMSSRKTKPGHLYSDNGTNFVRANRELQQQFLQQTQNTQFLAELSDLGIEWHFNAPAWPSAGGLWESAVRILKNQLKRVVGDQKLTFEEYSTLLSQLEACLNSRPLCTLTEDPDDLNYLTPSHFLNSGPTLTILETEQDERTRWHRVRKIYEDIWKRWQAEYLSQLSVRSKWKQPQENIKINDVVIIHENNIPAGKWLLGRVHELHPGSDGYVRVVTLKTKNGYVKRPVVKLTLLPVNSNSTLTTIQPQASTSKPTQDKVSEPNRKGGRNTSSFVSMILSFIFFMTLATTAHCAYNVTKLSKALYFDKISTMQYIQDEWKLIVYYDINPYWEGTATFTKHLKQISAICDELKQEKLCDIMLLQLRHNFDELNHYNIMLLDSNAHVRKKRGLVNGIGSIANTLFGLLDENFAIQYQKDITLIRDNQNHLALLWKNQTSVIEAEHNLLQRVEDTINKQHKIINQHLNNLSKAANQLNKEVQDLKAISELAISFSIANNMIAKLRYIQDTLLDMITDLHHGMFNIHLLTPKQLQTELNVISGQLTKDLTLPINNIQTDLAKLYHLLKVRAGITRQFIIFEIRIPLANRESYELYKLIAIPQQVSNYTISVTPVSDYVAINLRKDTYIPLSGIDIQQCIQSDTYIRLCHSPRPVYQFFSDESLCYKDQITNKCHSTITPCHNKWHELSMVNTYLFYCCGHYTMRIICGDRISAVQVEQAGVIALGQNCVIKGQEFTIFAHRNQQSTMNVSGHFYVPDIPPINHVINISVPVPDIIIPPLENNQTTAQLRDLKQRIEQMKSETAIAGNISYHDVHQYAVIYVVMAGCLTTAVVYIYRCVQRRRHSRASSERPSEVPQPPATVAPRRAPRPRQRPPQPPQLQQASSEHELRDFTFHPV